MAHSGIAFFVSLSPELDDDDDLTVAAAALATSSDPSQPWSSASHGVSLLTAGAEHMLLKASGDGSTIVADKVPLPEVAVPVPQAVRVPHPPLAPPPRHLLRRRDHAAAKRVKKLEKRLQVMLVDSLSVPTKEDVMCKGRVGSTKERTCASACSSSGCARVRCPLVGPKRKLRTPSPPAWWGTSRSTSSPASPRPWRSKGRTGEVKKQSKMRRHRRSAKAVASSGAKVQLQSLLARSL